MTGRLLALAGALWATLACRDGSRPTATATLADTADQTLLGMSHYVTVAGVQRARVRADTAYFYSPTQRAELRGVHITFYRLDGTESSTLTAREGTYNWRNGDMEARGNVTVVTTDGRTLRTEQLRYSESKNEVTSHVPFVFDGPSRHVEGEGFTSDPEFKDVVAQHPKGAGGQFTLPNQ
jgi:LPS export ABC transporter protein LptC